MVYQQMTAAPANIWRVPGRSSRLVGQPLEKPDHLQPGRLLDFASGQTAELFRKDGPFFHTRLEVAPGEEWILYSEWPQGQSELMLMENFR